MTRSIAQQIEHWARLGKALEEAGLSPEGAMKALGGGLLLEAGKREARGRLSNETVSAQQMWSDKRAQQAKDIANVESGKVPAMAMGWFSSKRIKQVEILDSPY